MKKLILRLWMIFTLTLVFTGCDQTEQPEIEYEFPHTLNLYRAEAGVVRLFTENGEVFDQKKIAEFVKGAEKFFPTQDVFDDIDDDPMFIDFFTKDSLTGSHFALKYGAVREDGYLLFYSEKVSIIEEQSNSFSFKPFIRFVAPEINLGSGRSIRKEVYAAQGDLSNMVLWNLNYKFSHTSEGRREMKAGSNIFNVFDGRGISTLKENDTLAIQQNKLYFRP